MRSIIWIWYWCARVWKSCQTEYNEFRLICQSVVLCSMDFFCSFVTVSLIINCSKWKVLRWTHACICCAPVYKCMPGERVNQKNLTVFFFVCSTTHFKRTIKDRRRMRKSNCAVYLFRVLSQSRDHSKWIKNPFLTQNWIKWNVNARIFAQKQGNAQQKMVNVMLKGETVFLGAVTCALHCSPLIHTINALISTALKIREISKSALEFARSFNSWALYTILWYN